MAQVDLYPGSPDTREIPNRAEMQDILQMVGPLFGSASALDSMITQRPGELTVGAETIRRELMALEREVQYHSPPPRPQPPQQVYHPAPPYIGDPVAPVQHVQSPFTIVKSEPVDQLELNLDPSFKDLVSNSLKDISSKLSRNNELLTKLIEVLSSDKNVKKVRTKQNRVPKAVTQLGETE